MSLLSSLAPIDRFPTVDEVRDWATRIATDYPAVAGLETIGDSRNGYPLQLLSIAPEVTRGSVLVVGCPHPNEPIGMATIMTLAERLVRDPDAMDSLGVAWHFVPCADPDGTKLNEGWFAGPWTREHYARHFYRPGSESQVEWTFPFSVDGFAVDAPLPETVALMRAIDKTRPDVLCSLHNAEMGGAYFYAPEGAPGYYTELTQLCDAHGIPLHRGEPETPLSVELAPSVYSVPTAAGLYSLAKSFDLDPAGLISGGSSLDYASQYKSTFPVVIELPYWRDPRASDTNEDASGRTRREVVLEGLDQREADVDLLERLIDSAEPLPESPFADAVRSFLAQDRSGWLASERAQAETDDAYDRPVTVAEAMTVTSDVHIGRLRMIGMLLRALPVGTPAHGEAERLFSDWAEQAADDDQSDALPIADLVAVQAGAMLAAVSYALPREPVNA